MATYPSLGSFLKIFNSESWDKEWTAMTQLIEMPYASLYWSTQSCAVKPEI